MCRVPNQGLGLELAVQGRQTLNKKLMTTQFEYFSNSSHVLSVYNTPGIVLNAFHVSFQLVLTTNLGGRCCLYFEDVGTEA